MKKIIKTDTEWQQQLTPEQYTVCRLKGTEPAFSGNLYTCKEPGVYHCVCCGNSLFNSEQKYDSGSGWPSFWAPVKAENIAEQLDEIHGMRCVEVLCAKCDAHLGHKFLDGPEPTGQRYCINSVALSFSDRQPENE